MLILGALVLLAQAEGGSISRRPCQPVQVSSPRHEGQPAAFSATEVLALKLSTRLCRRATIGKRAGMNVNYIHLAIPVFFLLIGIEVLAARLLERDVYRLNDSINDLSCGILDQVVEVFLKTVLFAGYLFIYERG